MKMFKKLMAVVLTGALAVSMLTGCALGDAAASKVLRGLLPSTTTTRVVWTARLRAFGRMLTS